MTTEFPQTPTELLRQQLAEAQAALHQLLVRGGLVMVRKGDELLEYKPQDAGDLRAYIASLQAQLGLPMTGRTRSRRILF